MIHINQFKLNTAPVLSAKKTDRLEELLLEKIAEILKIQRTEIAEITILRESVDARRKPELFFIYTVEIALKNQAAEDKLLRKLAGGRGKGQERNSGEIHHKGVRISRECLVPFQFPTPGSLPMPHSPVIVGAGPAGLFCAYFLALHGYRPLLLERGKDVDARRKDVEEFWRTAVLCPDSNVQFGEGGAGTFSDGKLNTLVKDKEGRGRAVLQVLVDCGAKESILYEAKPHLGTDVLTDVVRNLRNRIVEAGGEVRFESKVTDLCMAEEADGRRTVQGIVVNGTERIPCEQVVLAIGHSARDTFAMLYERKIPMEAKSFAVGLRVEHPQRQINLSQYGVEAPGALGAAPYKVVAKAENGRGVYSFCMCPGGYVVNASSEEGRLAVNGMSYSGRDGANANSAVIVSVTPEDFGFGHPLAGIAFQRELEKRAYDLAEGKIPMQRYGVFKKCVECGCTEEELASNGQGKEPAESHLTVDIDTGMFLTDNANCEFMPMNRGLSAWADVSRILPAECNQAFVQGMESFGRQIKGFDREDAILSGVESRTSSPVRIPRDETGQSLVRGLYPCGEGAGYAGGITSAAMDGLHTAEKIAADYAPF